MLNFGLSPILERQCMSHRIEKDSLGEFKVPVNAWYGIQTARAVDNFPISGRMPDRDFIKAHVAIKLAAANANCQPGWLDETQRDAIVTACKRVLNDEFLDQFVVDRFQAGAGTSHNMNTNEVVSNLANVALGGEKGQYTPIHPNELQWGWCRWWTDPCSRDRWGESACIGPFPRPRPHSRDY